MSDTEFTHTVYLGSQASIWSHRGYVVRGERVMCDSLADAETVLARALPNLDSMVAVDVDAGTYYYDTQEDADADADGSRCVACVAEVRNG